LADALFLDFQITYSPKSKPRVTRIIIFESIAKGISGGGVEGGVGGPCTRDPDAITEKEPNRDVKLKKTVIIRGFIIAVTSKIVDKSTGFTSKRKKKYGVFVFYQQLINYSVVFGL